MTYFVVTAILGGILVSLSRQINGRLALSTSALMASFWNHLVGFAALSALMLTSPALLLPDLSAVPFWAWFGGPVGVLFVAAGSWLILRIGAAATALLVIAGQMVAGVVLDLLTGVARSLPLDTLGVVLIMAGVALTTRRGGSTSRQ